MGVCGVLETVGWIFRDSKMTDEIMCSSEAVSGSVVGFSVSCGSGVVNSDTVTIFFVFLGPTPAENFIGKRVLVGGTIAGQLVPFAVADSSGVVVVVVFMTRIPASAIAEGVVVNKDTATIFLVFFGRAPTANFIGKRGVATVVIAAWILGIVVVSVVTVIGKAVVEVGVDGSLKASTSAAVAVASPAVADVVGTDVMLARRREKVAFVFAASVVGVFFSYRPTPWLTSFSLGRLLPPTHSPDKFAPDKSASAGDASAIFSLCPPSAAEPHRIANSNHTFTLHQLLFHMIQNTMNLMTMRH